MPKTQHKTSGIHKILDFPFMYNMVQFFFSHERTSKAIENLLNNREGVNVLDIGCGTGENITRFEGSNYFGLDISESYIENANSKFGDKGKFFCASVSELNDLEIPNLDIVIMFGVLHHLRDSEIEAVFLNLKQKLNTSGFVLTLDPVFLKKQNFIANFFINLDRGKNVKSLEQYSSMSHSFFSNVELIHIHQSFPPYDRLIQKLSAPIS